MTMVTAHDIRARVRQRKRMNRVDDMPPALRACVHDFGLTLVDQFIACGVTNPRHIRHLITACWQGSTEVGKRDFGWRSGFDTRVPVRAEPQTACGGVGR